MLNAGRSLYLVSVVLLNRASDSRFITHRRVGVPAGSSRSWRTRRLSIEPVLCVRFLPSLVVLFCGGIEVLPLCLRTVPVVCFIYMI